MPQPDAVPRPYVVLIPAFEPGSDLVRIAGEVAATRPRAVVVVDDGSSVACGATFRALAGLDGVTVLRHERNLGKGEAIKTGLRHVLAHVPDAAGAVTMDADGQHALGDVLRVGERLACTQGALVLGERAFHGEVPLRSRLGNTLTRAIVNLATGLRLTDTQTGLRGIPLGLFDAVLGIASSRYEFELDMLFLCRERRIPVVGVPVETVYIDGNRSSHFRPLHDSARIYGRLLANLARLAARRPGRRRGFPGGG
jgi:glycosyltransferase involved in cell wall biosynthesis